MYLPAKPLLMVEFFIMLNMHFYDLNILLKIKNQIQYIFIVQKLIRVYIYSPKISLIDIYGSYDVDRETFFLC